MDAIDNNYLITCNLMRYNTLVYSRIRFLLETSHATSYRRFHVQSKFMSTMRRHTHTPTVNYVP